MTDLHSLPSRHDLLLVAIAVPMVLAAVAGAALPVGMAAALGVGSVPACGSVGYALFYRPPEQSG